MITISFSDKFVPERTYIIDTLFADFLGLQYEINLRDMIQHYEIVVENGKSLVVKDHFFEHFKDGLTYLDPKELPSRVNYVKNRFIPNDDIPVLMGNDQLTVEENKIICGIDIFASSFFMLSRWEEYANKVRDYHGRFPSFASLAAKQGFLKRAVVNEYVEMLWSMLSHLKCTQERKRRSFSTILTHDVDFPFQYALKSTFAVLRQMGGDAVKRKDGRLALNNAYKWLGIRRGDVTLDPFYTFDDIMERSERCSLKSTFMFISGCSDPRYDGNYDIGHKAVRGLLRHICDRGHDIGIHPSYGSYRNAQQTRKEAEILQTLCQEEGIEQNYWHSRQHYLRFEVPTTFENLECADIDVDLTLSYADAAGFRCGVCYEYSVFNILTRKRLDLRERPLVVMECSVIDERYMNLGTGEEAFSVIKSIKDTCRRFSGDFIILWHNTRFIDQRERELYDRILQA